MLSIQTSPSVCWSAKRLSFTESQLLMTLKTTPIGNNVGKGEIVGNQHFRILPQCFSMLSKTNFKLSVAFILLSANVFNLDKSESVLLLTIDHLCICLSKA